MLSTGPQPDQEPWRWDDHVCVYETVFEPFTLQFADAAIAMLGLAAGQSVLDVGAGCGGAALALARQKLRVTAIDASPRMVERISARAAEGGLVIDARTMDGQALQFADASFDAALSVLGVILFPDVERGLAEMRRVVRPGGAVSLVTWTQPERYELAAELRAATQAATQGTTQGTTQGATQAATEALGPDQRPAPLPAQLRYREEGDFRALFRAQGMGEPSIATVTARLEASSARWLAEHIGFAPGMAATMANLGDRAAGVMERLVHNLETRLGPGPIGLAGVAFVGTARVP
ncbi:MAG: class I SAM-dependent methyltransferase [Hyphomicrobiaceae bacterium]|nr:class I SAM-dependent methyltransferase [Hyphomicrobiaceae bacterium]